METVKAGTPLPVGAPPTWSQTLCDLTMRVATWIKENFKAIFNPIFDFFFPPFVPKAFPAEDNRPILELPLGLRPLEWDPQKIIATFQAGNEEHNVHVLLRAAERQLDHNTELPTKFYEILRAFKAREPFYAGFIQVHYCRLQDEKMEKDFFDRKDLSIKGIHDTLLLLEVDALVMPVDPKTPQEQLQDLFNLIPVQIEGRWEKNRMCTRVWYVVERLSETNLVLIPIAMKGINKEFKVDLKDPKKTLKDFLKGSDPDLGLLRLALNRMLAE